jgi:hypothetical protein
MTAKFYVYEHWRSDKNEPFYVGKGQKRRAFHMHKTTRNAYHLFIQEKLKRIGATIDVRIVVRDLSEKEAFEEETRRILFWRAEGCNLANFTTGGEGFSGGRHSDEWCQELSERAKGWWKNPEYREKILSKTRGLKRTEEQKQKLRKPKTVKHIDAMKRSAKGRKKPVPRTEEHRKNVISALYKAWEEKKENPEYQEKVAKRRAESLLRQLNARDARREKKEFEAAQKRFMDFVNALIDGTERCCSTCKITKAPEQFTRTNQGPTGLSYVCKPCCAKNQQEMRDSKRLLQGSN